MLNRSCHSAVGMFSFIFVLVESRLNLSSVDRYCFAWLTERLINRAAFTCRFEPFPTPTSSPPRRSKLIDASIDAFVAPILTYLPKLSRLDLSETRITASVWPALNRLLSSPHFTQLLILDAPIASIDSKDNFKVLGTLGQLEKVIWVPTRYASDELPNSL